MATELNLEISRVEMERLQTSIKYHDWFLGFVVVVGVSLSIYIISSIQDLKEGQSDLGARIAVMQKDIVVMQKDIDVVKKDIDVIKKDIDTLNQKMDRYHSGAGT